MLWPKKKSYKEFDNEKKFLRPGAHELLLRLENSPPHPPPHNFSNGPSLIIVHRKPEVRANQIPVSESCKSFLKTAILRMHASAPALNYPNYLTVTINFQLNEVQ